jgi:hypothetical protein
VNGLDEVGSVAPQPRIIIKTIINGMTFDGSTPPMRQTARDALIALMAATAQAKAEPTKSAQHASIDHRPRGPSSCLASRSMTALCWKRVRLALGSAGPPSLSVIAKAEGWSKLTSEARVRVGCGGG